MTLNELINKSESYTTAISIERHFPNRLRKVLRYFFLILFISSFAGSFIDFNIDTYNVLPDGLFFLFFTFFIILCLIEFFYNSSKYSKCQIDFNTALIVSKVNDNDDLLAGFLKSLPGIALMNRLGIQNEEINSFLNSNDEKLVDLNLVDEDEKIDFAEYAKAIYLSSKWFGAFISSHGAGVEDYLGTAEWIKNEFDKKMKQERWWSRENLDAIPSIGTSFSYGQVFELSKYAVSLSRIVNLESLDIHQDYRKREVTQIENALVRGAEANAIIVDNDESVAKDIIARLSKKINLGESRGILEHKNVLELDWQKLIADFKDRGDLEREILNILYECMTAGNIILYIPNLPSFIADSKKIGVNIPSLLEEYLASPKINILAHAIKSDFYYFIEVNPGLARVFERIVPEEKGAKSSLPAILEKALLIESQNNGKIFFTYQSLHELAEISEKFVAYGEMPTKALDMLIEITPWAIKEDIYLVTKNDVDVFTSIKTGIAAGEISEAESQKLSQLEDLLHKRIISQDEAIKAVSSAMRRSRAGVGNPKRPIASFLFLGPTGVGKTETAKALAESFFGDEEKITRFDMSEYQGADALPRLIGSFSEGRVGNLASKLRDAPYGVVLLDELEKAAPDVLNLFLRILDEGKFTDAFGGEVNTRNSIIIATSNAGSELIWEIVKKGESLEKKKSYIVDHLIHSHIFKPELLNRFDSIVVYKPLETGDLRNVADIMMTKLIDRLKKEKQIELQPSSELLDYIVLHGSDKEFGARSMNRVMQEKIEDALARKIIKGEVRAGSVVPLGVKDII